jgi:enoyl-CoA hydratase/carnithine racemase
MPEILMQTSTKTSHLEYVDDKTIAVITLDDPLHANAMSPEMGDAFSAAIGEIQSNAAARVAIIRGAGKHFSIGGHRDMLIKLGNSGMGEAQLHEFMLGFYNRWLPMLDLEIPFISAIQGDCIGVAPVFACAPDIALADETLNLQITFAGLNFYPGMGIPYLLARKVGANRAAFLLMSNIAVSGREAERLGLVERCVAAGTAYDEALTIAREIVASSSTTVRLLKSRLGLRRADLQSELESNAAQQAKDLQTDEYRRRVAHYLPNHYDGRTSE